MRGGNARVGDERVAPNGYWYVKTEAGWRLKHHVKAEEYLGRSLRPNERVHFSNGDKEDYSPTNLVVREAKRTKANRIAALKERIAALQSELHDLENS